MFLLKCCAVRVADWSYIMWDETQEALAVASVYVVLLKNLSTAILLFHRSLSPFFILCVNSCLWQRDWTSCCSLEVVQLLVTLLNYVYDCSILNQNIAKIFFVSFFLKFSYVCNDILFELLIMKDKLYPCIFSHDNMLLGCMRLEII